MFYHVAIPRLQTVALETNREYMSETLVAGRCLRLAITAMR